MENTFFFDHSAELYQNEDGELAIRFANNEVYTGVGEPPGEGFVAEAIDHLQRGDHPGQWLPASERKLRHDGHGWHLVSSMGFIDEDPERPGVSLDVRPEELGERARDYLHPSMPEKVPAAG